jgi:polygalacturonase
MRANNITIRDMFVTGGDDNVCIKNDTANVLIENVVFHDGHGASIGSIPDCSGCHGVVTNITFRNITMGGDAPMKIKWWANTTGEISNILYEDVTLSNASSAIQMSANYGSWACPCTYSVA